MLSHTLQCCFQHTAPFCMTLSCCCSHAESFYFDASLLKVYHFSVLGREGLGTPFCMTLSCCCSHAESISILQLLIMPTVAQGLSFSVLGREGLVVVQALSIGLKDQRKERVLNRRGSSSVQPYYLLVTLLCVPALQPELG